MKFKLNYKGYLILTITIWLLFFIFAINKLSQINGRDLIPELIISVFLIQFSVMVFIGNWYKIGRPTLLDWFRLSTFLSIIYSYFKLIDKFDNKIEWVYGRQYFNKDYILPTLTIVLIGLVTLYFSEIIFKFILRKRKSKHSFDNTVYQFRNEKSFYLIAGTTLAVYTYLLLTGRIGYGSSTEQYSGSFAFLQQILLNVYAFILSTLAVFKFYLNDKRKLLNFFFYLFFIGQVVLALLSGMKGNVIYTFITVLIPYLLSGKAIPKKYIIISIIPALLLYPLIDNYRQVLTVSSTLSKDKAFALAFNRTFEGDFSDNLSSGSSRYSSRLEMFPVLLYSVELEKEWTDYKYMDRYVFLPFSFFPRFLIPDKPIADTGEKLNYMISGYKGNSQTPTTYGWSYFEGGELFVVFTFLLLAFFICVLEYRIGYDSLFGLLFYINLIIVIFVVEHDVYFLLSKIFQSFIVYYFLYKLFFTETDCIDQSYPSS